MQYIRRHIKPLKDWNGNWEMKNTIFEIKTTLTVNLTGNQTR